jgi:hypothetical protein
MEPSVKRLCLFVTLALTACHLGEAPTAAAPTPAGGIPANLVLRSYDVPGDGAPQVRAVLKDVFWIGSDGKDSNRYLGRSEVGPNGRLVVMASEGVQEGVKAFIDSLSAQPPKPAATIETSYWLVLATPGHSAPHPAALSEVASALQQIEHADGPMEFALGEKLSMSQISGESARVIGRDADVRQTISARGDGVSAEMSIAHHGQKFESRVNLKSGQLLVLGSAGSTAKDEAQRSLYVLMRASIHDGKSP